MSKEKYIAIKVIGIDHWLWFEKEKTEIDSGMFIGKAGWGRYGAFTEIKVNENQIIGKLESDKLQY